MVVVAVISIVVAVVVAVASAVALRRAGAARAAAERTAKASEEAAAAARAEADEARAAADTARQEADQARAAQQDADERAAAADARAEAARGDAAEAADRAEQAALAARAAGLPWVEVLWRLEGLRAERTWRSVAPGSDALPTPASTAAFVRQGLEVELQWLREVVGTPGRLVAPDDPDTGPSAPPAPLVALRMAQEALDVLAKKAEELDVAVTGDAATLEVRIGAADPDAPVDPEGRLARLADATGAVGAKVELEEGDGRAVVRLAVPTGAASGVTGP